MEKRIYLAIDLKSFYASVECAERHLDPLTANLVVADRTRTEKTICLAVSPSLKAYGIPGRSRLFEVEQAVKEINRERLAKAPRRRFSGSSFDDSVLRSSPELKLDYIAAPPRMALYMDYSARIYQIYLRYAAPEDIHVYSIDEVFIDITSYLEALNMTPYQLAGRILGEIREYHQEKKNTILLVSHSMEDIARNATMAMVMNQSRLFCYDTVENVFGRAAELQGMGLTVPQVSQVFLDLRRDGLEVDPRVYTVEAARDQILRKAAERGLVK